MNKVIMNFLKIKNTGHVGVKDGFIKIVNNTIDEVILENVDTMKNIAFEISDYAGFMQTYDIIMYIKEKDIFDNDNNYEEGYDYMVKINSTTGNMEYYNNSNSEPVNEILLDSTKEYYLYFSTDFFGNTYVITFEEFGDTINFKFGNDSENINDETYKLPPSPGDDKYLLYFNNNKNTWDFFQTNITFYLGYLGGESENNIDGTIQIYDETSILQETINVFGNKEFNFDIDKIYKIKFGDFYISGTETNVSDNVYFLVNGNTIHWSDDEYYIFFDTNNETWIVSNITFELNTNMDNVLDGYEMYIDIDSNPITQDDNFNFSLNKNFINIDNKKILKFYLDNNSIYRIYFNIDSDTLPNTQFSIENSEANFKVVNNSESYYLKYENNLWAIIEPTIYFKIDNLDNVYCDFYIDTINFENIHQLQFDTDIERSFILDTSLVYMVYFSFSDSTRFFQFANNKSGNISSSIGYRDNLNPYYLKYENNLWKNIEPNIIFELITERYDLDTDTYKPGNLLNIQELFLSKVVSYNGNNDMFNFQSQTNITRYLDTNETYEIFFVLYTDEYERITLNIKDGDGITNTINPTHSTKYNLRYEDNKWKVSNIAFNLNIPIDSNNAIMHIDEDYVIDDDDKTFYINNNSIVNNVYDLLDENKKYILYFTGTGLDSLTFNMADNSLSTYNVKYNDDPYYLSYDKVNLKWDINNSNIKFQLKKQENRYTLTITEILSEYNVLTFEMLGEPNSDGSLEYSRLLDINKTYKIILKDFNNPTDKSFIVDDNISIDFNNNNEAYLFYDSVALGWVVVSDYNIVFKLSISSRPITMSIVDEIDSTNKFDNKVDLQSIDTEFIFNNILNTSRKYIITFDYNFIDGSIFTFGKNENDFYEPGLQINKSYGLIFENNDWVILDTNILFQDSFENGENWDIARLEQDGISELTFKIGTEINDITNNIINETYPSSFDITRENGWAIIDSDSHNDQTSFENAWLTTKNSIDIGNMQLYDFLVKFGTVYKDYFNCRIFMIVSWPDSDNTFKWPEWKSHEEIDLSTNNFDSYYIFEFFNETTDGNFYEKIGFSILDKIPSGTNEIKIRFNWTGRWSYYWIIDDIEFKSVNKVINNN